MVEARHIPKDRTSATRRNALFLALLHPSIALLPQVGHQGEAG